MEVEFKIGETYYTEFNLLYQDTPFDWEWKCVDIENDVPILTRVKPYGGDKYRLTELSNLRFKTKDEVLSRWGEEKVRVSQILKDEDGIIDFMIEKLEDLSYYNEYGYSFTTIEREEFKKKLLETFKKEINI